MILRGIKKIEYRSRPTRVIGETFYIYTARTPGPAAEFAAIRCRPGDLPSDVIVGTARITRCTRNGHPRPRNWEWRLSNVRRLKRPRRPRRMPQPVWFRPF